MAWSTALVVLLAIVAAFYLFGGSIVLWLSSLVLKNWRYTSRGFEWDKDTDAVIPTLLIRRFSFHWGGRKAWSKGGSGLLVLKASGISFRRGMEHDGHERTDEPAVKVGSRVDELMAVPFLLSDSDQDFNSPAYPQPTPSSLVLATQPLPGPTMRHPNHKR